MNALLIIRRGLANDDPRRVELGRAVLDVIRAEAALVDQVAAVRVDKDRAVRRALATAEDCEQHGKTLTDLHHRLYRSSVTERAAEDIAIRASVTLLEIQQKIEERQRLIAGGLAVGDPEKLLDEIRAHAKRAGDAIDRRRKKAEKGCAASPPVSTVGGGDTCA